jgi:hypothetical protein
LTVALIN